MKEIKELVDFDLSQNHKELENLLKRVKYKLDTEENKSMKHYLKGYKEGLEQAISIIRPLGNGRQTETKGGKYESPKAGCRP